jgi:hypothetical protein
MFYPVIGSRSVTLNSRRLDQRIEKTSFERGSPARGGPIQISTAEGQRSCYPIFPIATLYITAEESFLFHFALPGPNLAIPVGSAPTRAIADGHFWFPP